MKKGIIAVLSTIFGAAAGATAVFKLENDKMKKEKELDCKNDAILKVFSQWLYIKQEGKSLTEYFVEKGYQTIAVYGMHYLGECLIEELKDSGVEVKYAIDRNADKICSEVDVYTLDDKLPGVDAVVVTAFYYFDEIEDALHEKMGCPIISIEDVVYEV